MDKSTQFHWPFEQIANGFIVIVDLVDRLKRSCGQLNHHHHSHPSRTVGPVGRFQEEGPAAGETILRHRQQQAEA